ncbi:MAG: isoprenylcysteine carboxylmethyltransferase family protein [Pseudomonadota bacterium]
MSEGAFPWRDAILALLVLERLAELWVARGNAKALRARGGIEAGAGHYPLLVALHVAWLAALILFVPRRAPIDLVMLAGFAVLMAARAWVLVALGRYWTTRIITIPGAPLVRRGPYRYLRHPNYLVVAGEIIVLPLVFGAWEIALVFTALNLPLLAYRIRIEDRALAERRALSVRDR